MEPAAPVIKKMGRPVTRRRLLVIGALVVLGMAFYLHARSPHFSGSIASSIDITMRPPDPTRAKTKVLMQASISDAQACAALLALLRSARWRTDHKCGDLGVFTIHYSNGKTDTLNFLPGHDPTGYEFRFDSALYRLPRDRFYKVLRDGGIDTTRMPEIEH